QHWPMKILFFCEIAPETGGETPLCSSRNFFRSLDKSIVEQFERRGGVTYIRNFDPYIPFSSLLGTFNTYDRKTITRICLSDDIAAEWKSEEWLQTRQTRPAFRTHPRTGERFFVAGPHIWHHSCWIKELETLGSSAMSMLGRDPTDYWMHILYADGSEIEQ